MEHSVFGGSGAHRWLKCPGSINAEKGLRDFTDSIYAAEGTFAHMLFEKALRTGNPAETWLEVSLDTSERLVTQEMADYVQTSVDLIKSRGGEQEYEQKVSYEDYAPGGFGTADVIIAAEDTLIIADLKYGKGVRVDAKENEQLMLYALGALTERQFIQKFEKVGLLILQPRLNHFDYWETTPERLYNFGYVVNTAAKLALEPDAERIPGEKQCRWCKAKATCPALSAETEDAIMTKFKEMDESTAMAVIEDNDGIPVRLSDDVLKNILDHKNMIIDWLKAVEDHVKNRIESGESFPGYKLVYGRSIRKWNDEPKAERLLRRLLGASDAYEKKLLSVAKAEKALGKEKKYRIEKLIEKPVGPLTLVPEEDKREGVQTLNVTADQLDF